MKLKRKTTTKTEESDLSDAWETSRISGTLKQDGISHKDKAAGSESSSMYNTFMEDSDSEMTLFCTYFKLILNVDRDVLYFKQNKNGIHCQIASAENKSNDRKCKGEQYCFK